MSDLDDALSDLFRDATMGRDLVESAKEVAAEYGLHVNLLVRRFNERYQSAEIARDKARKTAEFSIVTKVDNAKAEAFLRAECDIIGLNPEFYLPVADRKEVLLRFCEGTVMAMFANMIEFKVEIKPVF